MDTHFDTPPAENTRSRFNTPPARNTRSRTRRSRITPYPVATPELNNGRTNTPHHETVATPLFGGRSVLPSQKVSEEQLLALIRSDGLSNDISYEVHGSVQISNRPDLKFLSGKISVKGSLLIHECPELRTISANLFVGGDLLISHCPLLASIDGSVTVKGGIIMPHVTGLVDLPGTFCISGPLYLMCCSHLRDLSGSFSVRCSARFDRCKRLRDLSGNFYVGDKLDLSCCNHLTDLSGTFAVGGKIDLNHCTRLGFVPDWITSLGRDSKGNIRYVDLTFTGLSDASIDLLHSANIPGVQFETTDEETRRPQKVFNNLPQALAFWRDLACSNMDTPQLNLQPEQTEDMLDFLEQLTWTQEYDNKKYRPILAQRVIQVITLVLMDDHLREEALTHISNGTSKSDEVVYLGLQPLEGMLKGGRLQSFHEYLTRKLPINSA